MKPGGIKRENPAVTAVAAPALHQCRSTLPPTEMDTIPHFQKEAAECTELQHSGPVARSCLALLQAGTHHDDNQPRILVGEHLNLHEPSRAKKVLPPTCAPSGKSVAPLHASVTAECRDLPGFTAKTSVYDYNTGAQSESCSWNLSVQSALLSEQMQMKSLGPHGPSQEMYLDDDGLMDGPSGKVGLHPAQLEYECETTHWSEDTPQSPLGPDVHPACVKGLMQKLNMSEAELARVLDLPEEHLHQWFSGARCVRPVTTAEAALQWYYQNESLLSLPSPPCTPCLQGTSPSPGGASDYAESTISAFSSPGGQDNARFKVVQLMDNQGITEWELYQVCVRTLGHVNVKAQPFPLSQQVTLLR